MGARVVSSRPPKGCTAAHRLNAGERGCTVNHADAERPIQTKSTAATYNFLLQAQTAVPTHESEACVQKDGRSGAPRVQRARVVFQLGESDADACRYRCGDDHARRMLMPRSLAPKRARVEEQPGGNYTGRLCLCRPANANQKCPREPGNIPRNARRAFRRLFLHAPPSTTASPGNQEPPSPITREGLMTASWDGPVHYPQRSSLTERILGGSRTTTL